MYAERHVVSVTTDASGDVIGYTPAVTGRILGIRYVKNNFDNGHDFTVTLESSGESVMVGTNVDASASFYPRIGVTDAAGAAATLDGTRLARDYVVAAQDRVKIVVAAGGNAKSGAYHVIVG
jgi:hypothetical protein